MMPVSSSAGFTLTTGSITGVRFSASPTTPTTATAITVDFTSSVALRTGDTITLAWTDFTVTTGVTAAATKGTGFDSGVTFTASGATANGITLTLAGTGGLSAGTTGTLRVTGYTTPAAKTIAKAGLTLRTSQVTTAVASSEDVVIGGVRRFVIESVSSTANTVTVSYSVQDERNVPLAGIRVRGVALSARSTTPPASFILAGGGLGNAPASTITSAGTNRITITGLTAATAYRVYLASDEAIGINSRPVTTTAPAITNVRFSPSTTAADAAIALTAEFTTPSALATGNAITLSVTDFVVPTSGLTVSAASGFSTGTTYAVASTATTITITITGTAPPDARLSLTVSGTGLKNPATAKTIAKAGLTVKTTPDTTAVASSEDVVIRAAVPALTDAALTLSNTAAGATGVTLTVTFNTPVPLPAGGRIVVTLPAGFSTSSGPTQTFVAPSNVTAGSQTLRNNNQLTVFVNSALPAGVVTFTAVTFTNPATPAAARSDIRIDLHPDRFGQTVTAPTSAATLPAIAAPALTNAAVTLSNAAPGATGVTATIAFRTPSAIPGGGKIVVELPGFTWPATPVATFTAPSARANTAAFANGRLTITLGAGADIPAGSAAGTVTLQVTGATNPAAQPARTNVVMRTTTSADQPIAETSSGTLPAIAAAVNRLVIDAPASVTVNSPFQVTVRVVDASGATVRTATPLIVITMPSGMTCTSNGAVFAVNGTAEFAGCRGTLPRTSNIAVQASGFTGAVHEIAVREAVARLEFVTQPSDSTTGVADINVRVRAVKADGTTDTAFNNQVELVIQGSGSTFGLGSVTAIGGVATFTRTYNPTRADATWTLRATQISGRTAGVYAPATSDSFRVTRQPYLGFLSQPSDGTAGAALPTQPQVQVYRADGGLDTAFTGTVTLTLKADTANGAALTSTAPGFQPGTFTFIGTSVNNAGTDYVLVASATGYASAASEPFNITSTATQIVITQYPSTFAVGRDYTIEVRAEARDAAGRVVPGAASELGLLLNGNSTTQRIATTPTAVENGVAIFRVTHRFASAGEYRWGVDHVGGSRNLPQANTDAFTVAKPAARLAFVVQPGGFGSILGTQPVVEIQDEDGNRVPGATNEVTLTFVATNDTDPIMTGGARRAATAGQVKYTAVGFTGGTARPGSTFTITASATGLTSATSASFGPAGPTTKLAFTSDLPCGLVARPGCSPAAREGQQFTITVAAQDASGQVNTNESGIATLTGDGNTGMAAKTAPFVSGVATLTGDGNTGMAAKTAPFVSGVATFTNVSFTSASTTGYTLTATSGALTVSSGRIVVTQDNTPASLRFTAVPTHEVSGVAFTTWPEVRVYNAAGRELTGDFGNMVVRLRKQGETTTALLGGGTNVATANGVARFTDLRVTGADTNLYLTATLEGTTLEATQTGTFRVYADAASATTARASGQTQSKSFSLTLNIRQSAAGSMAASAFKNDVCTALKLDVANCARVSVTSVSSSSIVIEITDASLITTANVEVIDGQEIITLGGVDLVAFQAEFGAGAPAGTSALYAVGRIAYDGYGNRLEELSAPQSFSLPVPESVLLPGARPGDLKVAWWDGEQWVQVPTRAVVEEDGSFRVTATTNQLGAFAMLYAPGASRIDTSGVFSANGVGSGVFVGGSAAALAHAAGLNDATTLWVQDAGGTFRVLVVGGPAFLAEQFTARFPDGFAGPTPVTLVRASASPVTSGPSAPASGTTPATPTASGTTASGTTHTVAPGETMSSIGARYGVDWMRIAEANGISGPDYLVRDGLVLTIPQ